MRQSSGLTANNTANAHAGPGPLLHDAADAIALLHSLLLGVLPQCSYQACKNDGWQYLQHIADHERKMLVQHAHASCIDNLFHILVAKRPASEEY